MNIPKSVKIGATLVGGLIVKYVADDILSMRKVKCPACQKEHCAFEINKCDICNKRGCTDCGVDYIKNFIEEGVRRYFNKNSHVFDCSGILTEILVDESRAYGMYCCNHANQKICEIWDMKEHISPLSKITHGLNNQKHYSAINKLVDRFIRNFDNIKVYRKDTNEMINATREIRKRHDGKKSSEYVYCGLEELDELFDANSIEPTETMEFSVIVEHTSNLWNAIVRSKLFASFHGYDVVFDFDCEDKSFGVTKEKYVTTGYVGNDEVREKQEVFDYRVQKYRIDAIFGKLKT